MYKQCTYITCTSNRHAQEVIVILLTITLNLDCFEMLFTIYIYLNCINISFKNWLLELIENNPLNLATRVIIRSTDNIYINIKVIFWDFCSFANSIKKMRTCIFMNQFYLKGLYYVGPRCFIYWRDRHNYLK